MEYRDSYKKHYKFTGLLVFFCSTLFNDIDCTSNCFYWFLLIVPMFFSTLSKVNEWLDELMKVQYHVNSTPFCHSMNDCTYDDYQLTAKQLPTKVITSFIIESLDVLVSSFVHSSKHTFSKELLFYLHLYRIMTETQCENENLHFC